jgi:hypothetical protein
VLHFVVASKFMACLSQSGTVDEEQISTEQLDSVFGPLRELVHENIQQQEAILERVQVRQSMFVRDEIVWREFIDDNN